LLFDTVRYGHLGSAATPYKKSYIILALLKYNLLPILHG